jgi:hypothetical protein
MVGSLCDAYAHHWDLEVINVMKEEHFAGIMGVPNATGLWQAADIRNNGILKIKWVQAKRILLQKKREDLAKPLAERRVPEGQHDRIMPSDLVILINMVFGPSHCDAPMNRRTIAASGVVPFTKILLQHPDVLRGESSRLDSRAAATDVAVGAAAGTVNTDALGLPEIRELGKLKREVKRKMRHGMQIEDDGVAPGDLDQDAAARLAAMDKVKAKGGAIFGAAMASGDVGGIEFTGDYVRTHALRIADAHAEKAARQAADAALRAVAATTEAGKGAQGGGKGKGRGGGRGGRGRGRVAWKEVTSELAAQLKDRDETNAALLARIRQLEAEKAGHGPNAPLAIA